MKLIYSITVIISLIGIYLMWDGIKNSATIMQEIESTLLGVAFSVIPYVISRSIEKVIKD
jgi:drug/metabolite transporter superfamily protein YnfA